MYGPTCCWELLRYLANRLLTSVNFGRAFGLSFAFYALPLYLENKLNVNKT